MKKTLTLILTLAMVLSLFCAPVSAADRKDALSTDIAFECNGEPMNIETYNIDNYGFYKLRDIAAMCDGTDKEFSVDWDEDTQMITLVSGGDYTITKDDLQPGGGKTETAIVSEITVIVNGVETAFTAYNINGYTYYKLRELCEALDIYVSWNEETRTSGIDTTKNYDGTDVYAPEPEPDNTCPYETAEEIIEELAKPSTAESSEINYRNPDGIEDAIAPSEVEIAWGVDEIVLGESDEGLIEAGTWASERDLEMSGTIEQEKYVQLSEDTVGIMTVVGDVIPADATLLGKEFVSRRTWIYLDMYIGDTLVFDSRDYGLDYTWKDCHELGFIDEDFAAFDYTIDGTVLTITATTPGEYTLYTKPNTLGIEISVYQEVLNPEDAVFTVDTAKYSNVSYVNGTTNYCIPKGVQVTFENYSKIFKSADTYEYKKEQRGEWTYYDYQIIDHLAIYPSKLDGVAKSDLTAEGYVKPEAITNYYEVQYSSIFGDSGRDGYIYASEFEEGTFTLNTNTMRIISKATQYSTFYTTFQINTIFLETSWIEDEFLEEEWFEGETKEEYRQATWDAIWEQIYSEIIPYEIEKMLTSEFYQ